MKFKKSFYSEIFFAGGMMAAAIIIIVAVLASGGAHREDDRPALPRANATLPFSAPEGVSWPTARGDAGLSGLADPMPRALRRVWTARLEGPVRSAAVLGNGKAYLGCSDGRVYCLGLDSGEILWRFEAGSAVEAAPLLAGSLFVGTMDGDFFSISPSTGKEIWRARPGCKISGHANSVHSRGRPAVVFGGHDSSLHCLDAAVGETLWVFDAGGYVNGGPAIFGDLIFFGSCDGLVYAVGTDGELKATADAGSYVPGSVAVSDGFAFACHFENGIVCARASSMEVSWRYTSAFGDSPFFSSPAVGAGRVAAGSRDGYVHCVSAANGKLLWKAACGSAVDSAPVICGDRVLVATGEGRLLLLDVEDGRVTWSFDAGGGFSASPSASRGMFVVGSEDGSVHAFGPAAATEVR